MARRWYSSRGPEWPAPGGIQRLIPLTVGCFSGGLLLSLSLPIQFCILISPLILPWGGAVDPSLPVVAAPEVLADDSNPAEVARNPMGTDPLGQLERLQKSWNESDWEEALKRYLELPEDLRTAATFWMELDGVQAGTPIFPVIRDRAWRHLQDRLSVLDSPGKGDLLQEFHPRLDRLLLICTVTGMPLPDQAQKVRSHWRHRVQCRLKTDRWLRDLENAFQWDEIQSAGDLLRQRKLLPWLEVSVEERVADLVKAASGDLHSMISEAKAEGVVARVLDACQRLNALGAGSSESDEAHQWAVEKLRGLARHNLDMERRSHALLQLARLAMEEEEAPVNLGGLREQLVQPLRPEILEPGMRPREISSRDSQLLVGAPQLSEVTIEHPDSVPLDLEPVGRFWSRSPGHLADAKRWVDLVDSIVQLNRRWLECHPTEAPMIRERLQFHVLEAQRLGERLADRPARRSRLVWEELQEDPRQRSVRVTLSCPVTLFQEDGREIRTAVEISETLQPVVGEGIQMPVSRFEVETVHRRLLARLPAEIEALADRWADARLDRTLSEARALARGGAPRAALEMLLPALLGASKPEESLLEQASTDLAEWSGLGREAVELALGNSETP